MWKFLLILSVMQIAFNVSPSRGATKIKPGEPLFTAILSPPIEWTYQDTKAIRRARNGAARKRQ
uniref:Secreted protein n=1 Tax=Setaria digitata TaxID=48799 RepID=A0A915PJY9_9BILA